MATPMSSQQADLEQFIQVWKQHRTLPQGNSIWAQQLTYERSMSLSQLSSTIVTVPDLPAWAATEDTIMNSALYFQCMLQVAGFPVLNEEPWLQTCPERQLAFSTEGHLYISSFGK